MSRLPEKSTDPVLWQALQRVDDLSGKQQGKILEFIGIQPGDFIIVWKDQEAKKLESRDWFMAEVLMISALSTDNQEYSNLKVIDIETGIIHWTNKNLAQKAWINEITPTSMWCAN